MNEKKEKNNKKNNNRIFQTFLSVVQHQRAIWFLKLFRMGLFEAVHGWGQKGPLPEICHTYHTMMKLGTVIPYLNKIKKTYKSYDPPLSFADISVFSSEISNLLYQKMQI